MSILVRTAVLTIKQHLRSTFYLILALLQPVLFLLITTWLSGSDRAAVTEAIASTTVMGMWSTTLFGAGRALQRERRQGTLELLLVAPTRLIVPVAGICLGSAALGVLSAGSAVVVGVALTGQLISPTHGAVFAAALLVSLVCMAVLGLLISGLFVLLRQASVFTNVLEYPVWFACGLLVPLAARPSVLAAAGDVLTPTYVGVLLRRAIGSGALDVRAGLAVLILSIGYLGGALVLFGLVIQRVRRKGDLTTS